MRQHAVSTVRGLAAAGYCLKAEALRLAAVLAAAEAKLPASGGVIYH
jgi:hypothetical protein